MQTVKQRKIETNGRFKSYCNGSVHGRKIIIDKLLNDNVYMYENMEMMLRHVYLRNQDMLI